MPITDYDGQLQTIARNLGEEPALTNTDGLLEAIAKGTENIITEDKLDDYLPLAGGTLTGAVNGVTPDDSDNSTKLATTEFVDNVFLDKIISKLQETDSLPAGTSFPSATVLSQMIANMNTEDGVRYNFSNANAWYICLGAKYGGLIIQGGRHTFTNPSPSNVKNQTTITPPLTASTVLGVGTMEMTDRVDLFSTGMDSSLNLYLYQSNSYQFNSVTVMYIIICI